MENSRNKRFLAKQFDVLEREGGADSVAASRPRDSSNYGLPCGGISGSSVGPRWTACISSHQQGRDGCRGRLNIERHCEVVNILDKDGCAEIQLSNGKIVDVDVVITAIGVDPSPNLKWLSEEDFERGRDGGLLVDKRMQTKQPHVYAAGDACCIIEDESKHRLWFQMRLWSQARDMGVHAAHCMVGIEGQTASDMAFELFTHVTHFLGKRVVLLGLYNGQGISMDRNRVRLYSRVLGEDSERSFVRVLLVDGRIRGAICIGDTGARFIKNTRLFLGISY